MDLSVTHWLIAIAAAISVGLAKGGLSMVGTISVPLMTLVMSPVQAAGLLLPVYIISDLGGLIAYRKTYDRKVLTMLMPGAVFGILLGWATAKFVSDQAVELAVGLIGFCFALSALLARGAAAKARAPDWGRGSIWGTVAGYTSFVAHAGAAPYQVFAQPLRLSPMSYAGTTTIFFAICNWIKLIPYAALGQLSAENLKVALLLTVPALIAVRIGIWVVKRMSPAIFYKLITWMLLLVSIRLIWASLAELI